MEWEETSKGKQWSKEYHKQYYLKNKEKMLEQQRVRLEDPQIKAHKNKKDRERSVLYKAKIYEILGGAKCVHCGYDKDSRALQLDHINGGGRQDRKVHHNHATKYWLAYRNNPQALKDKFQVLCANCNVIKKYETNET